MKSWIVAGMAVLASMVFLTQCHVEPEEPVLVITARHLTEDPKGPDDPVWQQVKPVEVHARGRGSFTGEEVAVTTKAVYTDENLYFLFKWPDPTRSVAKRAWKFDGHNWEHMQGDEDRIALLFEITRIKGFASKGCAVVCHSPPDIPSKAWRFATQSAGEKGDLWHWKAARSNPHGYADDGWLTVAGNPSGSYRTTGRRYDSGDGGDVYNETENKTRPFYMQDSSTKPSAPGFLLFEEAVPILDDTLFNAGDVITYRMPKKAEGSRADVMATGHYGNGEWTVMLHRKLDTGHEDDVVFNPRRDYSFAMAVFDDTGDEHSKGLQAMTLRFGR